MTTTNYTEKARERRAADKRLREAAGDMAEALQYGITLHAGKVVGRGTGKAEFLRVAQSALKKAGVSL